MAIEDPDFLKRLFATFKVEADEHLKAMSSLLLALEAAPPPDEAAPLVETLFREAHSLKGAARSVSQFDIETVCQSMESLLAAIKRQQLGWSAAVFEPLYRAVDALSAWLAERGAQTPPADAAQIAALVQPLEAALQGRAPAPAAPTPVPAPSSPEPAAPRAERPVPEGTGAETVRISTDKLMGLMIQAEELLAFKYSAGHLAGELKGLRSELTSWRKDWIKTVRDARALRRASERGQGGNGVANGNHGGNGSSNGHGSNGNGANGHARNGHRHTPVTRILDAIERDDLVAKSLSDRLAQIEHLAEQERRALATMVDTLLEDMKRALMLPFGSLLELFPKLVRDLARDSGKEIGLNMGGAAIEIDRRILEQLKDPLIHLVRNAIDHGIEAPADRQRAGKARAGQVSVQVTAREGNQVELAIEDDGSGIDLSKVKASAQKLNLLSADAADGLDTAGTLDLVFESGLSTSPIITDLSGRGLGLAIVREKVEQLGGRVQLDSTPDRGTRFVLTLPTTLATFRGLLVTVDDGNFVLPSVNVERVVRVPQDSIRTAGNRETIVVNGEVMSLVWLADVLERPRPRNDSPYCQAVVLGHAARRAAFVVNEVVADQEVLVKQLGPLLKRVRNVAAATVLGAGRVVPILNVGDLLKSAGRADPARPMAESQTAAPERSLLVVEDSITSRSLLKGILEAAGYQVTTAVDGLDGLATLRSGQYDLVVSDVEMPRMDGFDLTARIRQDSRLTELPVVLVTALDSREDRERGIDVGADAYIVKSSFDQGNLLEVIRRLLPVPA